MSAGRAPRVLSASIRQRLLDLARGRGEDFQMLLDRYAVERLLYRLSVSEHRDKVLLKGALVSWPSSGELQPRGAIFMSSAIAIAHHSGSLLICNHFGDIAIATEAPLVAIPKQIRCKCGHVTCRDARVADTVPLEHHLCAESRMTIGSAAHPLRTPERAT